MGMFCNNCGAELDASIYNGEVKEKEIVKTVADLEREAAAKTPASDPTPEPIKKEEKPPVESAVEDDLVGDAIKKAEASIHPIGTKPKRKKKAGVK